MRFSCWSQIADFGFGEFFSQKCLGSILEAKFLQSILKSDYFNFLTYHWIILLRGNFNGMPNYNYSGRKLVEKFAIFTVSSKCFPLVHFGTN